MATGSSFKIKISLVYFFLFHINAQAEIRSLPVDYSLDEIKAVVYYQDALCKNDYKTMWNSMTKVHRLFFDNKYENYANLVLRNTKVGELLGRARLKEIKYITERRIWVELDEADIKRIKKALIEVFSDDRFRAFPYLIKEDGQWRFAHMARYFHTALEDIKLLNLAIQNYYRANGYLPQQLLELTHPVAYIPKIPVDPFNDANEPYIYKAIDSKSWMLYSFGPDSDDDSGMSEYNPFNGEMSEGDIISVNSAFSLIGETDAINYSSDVIKFVLHFQKSGRHRDYKIIWRFVTKLYQKIFDDDYSKFKKWHLERIKNYPEVDNIFINSRLREVKYINSERIWIEFYRTEPKIQEADPTTRGYYLIREDNIWKFGSLAKYMRIEVKNDMESLNLAIQNYYRANGYLPQQLLELTHPVAYIPKIPVDPFNDANEPYIYKAIDSKSWMLYSFGPDSDDDKGMIEYDIKNDPISDGDIIIR